MFISKASHERVEVERRRKSRAAIRNDLKRALLRSIDAAQRGRSNTEVPYFVADNTTYEVAVCKCYPEEFQYVLSDSKPRAALFLLQRIWYAS